MEFLEYSTLIYRILTITLLVLILPLCAITYYFFRLGQRKVEINRMLNILDITSKYREIYNFDIHRSHFASSVLFAMGISVIGLCALFLGTELKLAETPNLLLSGLMISAKTDPPCIKPECLIAYQQGALFVYGIGFISAYLWGLKTIFRRYMMNDLLPATFFRFGIRMIFASIIALLIYHAVGGFDGVKAASGGITPSRDGLLLLLVFLVGMFPQRGIKWMTTRVKMLTTYKHPSVRTLPLEMIEGMTAFDKERLEELSIDSCYDLATADFIPLFLKTPYCSRELIDWILQAKLCVKFGDAVGVLRQQGFRHITDLEDLNQDYLEQLAKDTSLNLSSLQRACQESVSDQNIARLKKAAELLGKYWEGEDRKQENQDNTK
ncbi:MAG: hypothetical protein QNL62_14980 [Gammaproteobacteria bacterium]|nr:hypothetical protein [Gammaproteobacteria bacterium]